MIPFKITNKIFEEYTRDNEKIDKNRFWQMVNRILADRSNRQVKRMVINTSDCTAVIFGRWLLKHCEPVWDGNALTWKYGGDLIDTLELFKKSHTDL